MHPLLQVSLTDTILFGPWTLEKCVVCLANGITSTTRRVLLRTKISVLFANAVSGEKSEVGKLLAGWFFTRVVCEGAWAGS